MYYTKIELSKRDKVVNAVGSGPIEQKLTWQCPYGGSVFVRTYWSPHQFIVIQVDQYDQVIYRVAKKPESYVTHLWRTISMVLKVAGVVTLLVYLQ